MIPQQVRKKKMTPFNTHFQHSQSKITGLNKMWSSKKLSYVSLDILILRSVGQRAWLYR